MSKEKTIFIFIGPPGSGKGSLSKLCVKHFGWSQLSTGDLCRKHISEKTDIGRQIDFAIKSGKLIEDNLIVKMVDEWLSECFFMKECVILDGFPRTSPQAEALDKFLNGKFKKAKLNVVRFLIDDDKVVARLTGRYICSNYKCRSVYSLVSGSFLAPKVEMTCDECCSKLIRRNDDSEQYVKSRIETYHYHENVLLNFYKNQGHEVKEFCVEKPLSLVFEEFVDIMGLNDK